MGDKEKGSVSANQDPGAESLPALVGRLGENILTLLDTKLKLLKIEIKEDLKGYLRNSISLGLGGIILLIGFALVNIAIAFFFAALFAETQFSQPIKYAFGFMITGLIYLLVGAFVFVKGKNRLQKQNLEPERSVKELEKDKQWLKENF